MKLRCISKRTSAQIFRYCKPTACCRPFDFALFRRCHTHIDSLCPFFLISTPAWGSGLALYVPRPRRQRVAGWQHKAHARCREASLNIQSCGECRNVAERSKRSGQKNLFRFTRLFNCGTAAFSYRFTIRLNRLPPLLCLFQASTWMPCFEKSPLRQASNWMPVVLTFSYVSVLQTDISIVFAARPPMGREHGRRADSISAAH